MDLPKFWRNFETLALPFIPLCRCLSEETLKSRWSLLSGVYVRGRIISHTGGKYVGPNLSWTPQLVEQHNSNNKKEPCVTVTILQFECSQYRKKKKKNKNKNRPLCWAVGPRATERRRIIIRCGYSLLQCLIYHLIVERECI